jgi:hypothetical protein
VPFELVTALVYQQAPEKIRVALEQLFQSIKQERLAEPPWTGQETKAGRIILENIVDIPGLVGVDKIALYYFLKRQIVFRYF